MCKKHTRLNCSTVQWALTIFLNSVLDIDKKDLLMCLICGPSPDTLVFDGIAMGFQSKKLKEWKKKNITGVPVSSEASLKGSKFQNFRMIIKLHKNRLILKQAADNREWPKVDKKTVDKDPSYSNNRKKEKVDK